MVVSEGDSAHSDSAFKVTGAEAKAHPGLLPSEHVLFPLYNIFFYSKRFVKQNKIPNLAQTT